MFTKLQSRRRQRQREQKQQVAATGNRQVLEDLARDWKKASSVEPANELTHDEDCPIVDSDSAQSEGEDRDADSSTSSIGESGEFGSTGEGESHLTDTVRDIGPMSTISEDWKAASSVEPANDVVALNQGYQSSPGSPEKQKIDNEDEPTMRGRLDDVDSIYDAEGGVVLRSTIDFASSDEEEC